MPIENEEQTIENENNETSDELLKLKKELAEEIVNKLEEKDPENFSIIFKGFISDYLVNEKTINDFMYDNILLGNILGIKTAQLDNLRKEISNVESKDGLENLRIKIFNEIDNNTKEKTPDTQLQETSPNNPDSKPSNGSQESVGSTEKAKVDNTSDSYEIDHLIFTISPETKKIWDNLKGKEKPDLEPFACALKVYNILKKEKTLKNEKYITAVDFTKKKGKKRFFVINMDNNTVEYAEKVGHGKKSGGDYATHFSNKHRSNESSLGAYLTPDAITKSPKKGRYGLRQIKGLESSNEQSDERGIAIHEGGENGSQGCFTLPKKNSKEIMEKIKGGSLVFAHAKSKEYFVQSKYFKQDSNGNFLA